MQTSTLSWNLTFLLTENPLSQFEVVSIAGLFTNMALFQVGNLVVMFVLLFTYFATATNVYAYLLRNVYQIVRSIVKENLFIKRQQYFTPLFYLFITLLLANLVGLLPYSFTITSSFLFTVFVAMSHFTGVNLIAAFQHKWQAFSLFLPGGAPLFIAPFLIFIEFVSYIARVLSLSIRLFANMMSGHALLKILIGFAWTLLTSGTVMVLIAVFPWVVVTAVMFLELLIAFLQAYVFTTLITLYINDVLTFHD